MMTIDIPDELQRKIISFARLARQTPEQAILEIIEERIDHQSAYSEMAYLMESKENKERLDLAIKDIRNGVFEEKEFFLVTMRRMVTESWPRRGQPCTAEL